MFGVNAGGVGHGHGLQLLLVRTPGFMKILHTSVVVVGLIGAGVLAWWWQNRAPAQAATVATGNPAGNRAGGPGGQSAGPSGPVPVEVGRVEAMRLEDDTQAVGTVRSRQGVMLRPEVSGRIAKLAFSDGQRVRRSQLAGATRRLAAACAVAAGRGAGQHCAHQPAAQPGPAGAELHQQERGRPEPVQPRGGRSAGRAGQGAAGAHADRGAVRRCGRPAHGQRGRLREGRRRPGEHRRPVVGVGRLPPARALHRAPQAGPGRCR